MIDDLQTGYQLLLTGLCVWIFGRRAWLYVKDENTMKDPAFYLAGGLTLIFTATSVRYLFILLVGLSNKAFQAVMAITGPITVVGVLMVLYSYLHPVGKGMTAAVLAAVGLSLGLVTFFTL